MEPSFQKQLMDVNGLPHKSIPVIIPGENFKINEKKEHFKHKSNKFNCLILL